MSSGKLVVDGAEGCRDDEENEDEDEDEKETKYRVKKPITD